MIKSSASRPIIASLFAGLVVLGASIAGTRTAAADTGQSGNSQSSIFATTPTVGDALRQSFASPDTGFINPRHRDVLTAFYMSRDFQPVWVDQHGPTRAAQQILDVLEDAASWGLTASDFVLSANRAPKMFGTWTADQAAAADVEISQLVIEYALQARGSRIPEPDTMLSTYLDRRPRLPDRAEVLASVAIAPGAVAVISAPARAVPEAARSLCRVIG